MDASRGEAMLWFIVASVLLTALIVIASNIQTRRRKAAENGAQPPPVAGTRTHPVAAPPVHRAAVAVPPRPAVASAVPIVASSSPASAPMPASPQAKALPPGHYSGVHSLGLIVFALVVVFGFHSCTDSFKNRERAPLDASVSAQVLCNKAIKLAARNPSTADIPYTHARAVEGGYQLLWPRGGGLRLENGFGAMQDASARCDVRGGRIEQLVVNGQAFL